LIFRKKTRVVLPGFAIVLVLAGWIAFRNLALWMVVSEPLPPSLDAIFTFAGETHRMMYSKELYARYPGSRWIISYPSKRIAIPLNKDGFDTARISIIDTCKNTYAEALFITDWAKNMTAEGHGYSNAKPLAIGLVSTPFHMRRIRMEVSRKFKDRACVFYYLPVPFERYGMTRNDYKTWWNRVQLRAAVVLEIKKLIYYSWKS
jgi:uncharacterized SAM-binding protein YcdF (DUF218 family)